MIRISVQILIFVTLLLSEEMEEMEEMERLIMILKMK